MCSAWRSARSRAACSGPARRSARRSTTRPGSEATRGRVAAMRCGLAQLELSARMDGEHVDARTSAAIDDHVAVCVRCRAFAASAARVRASVRIRAAEPVPDLVGRIVGELESSSSRRGADGHPRADGRRSRRAVSVVAALVAGAVIGSVLVGGPFRGRDQRAISATAVVRGVREASPALESFQGTYEVVERGLSPRGAAAPARRAPRVPRAAAVPARRDRSHDVSLGGVRPHRRDVHPGSRRDLRHGPHRLPGRTSPTTSARSRGRR